MSAPSTRRSYHDNIWPTLTRSAPPLTRHSHQFVTSRGNEYFCDVDEEYLTDRFNLTGLNTEVQYYQYALDLITDVFDLECDDEMREAIERSARHLYGLVHARYIITTRGQHKMVTIIYSAQYNTSTDRIFRWKSSLMPILANALVSLAMVKIYYLLVFTTFLVSPQ